MNTKLTLPWLKDNHIEAHYFGLGFIQVKIDALRRVHFYHPDVPAFVEEPHDHRYSFVSTVLRGALRNTIYQVGPGVESLVEYESCKKNGPEVPRGITGNVTKFGEFVTHAGSGYYLDSNTFHTVEPLLDLGPCVTFITRENPKKDFARVVRDPLAPAVCPFSKTLESEELWRIVSECLGV
jgi:hypothetical protein